jgi:hypothetical protein
MERAGQILVLNEIRRCCGECESMNIISLVSLGYLYNDMKKGKKKEGSTVRPDLS